MCDLLWSDPDDRVGWGISPRRVWLLGFDFVFVYVCIVMLGFDLAWFVFVYVCV